MTMAIQGVLKVVEVHPRVSKDTQNLYKDFQSSEYFPTSFEVLQIFLEYSEDGPCR